MPLSKTLRDHGWVHVGVCPETGLDIFRKPEWVRLGFGKSYRVTLSIVGDHILLAQPSGYATLHDILQVTKLTAQAAAEAFYDGRRYFHIVDLRNYQGSAFGARKHYMGEMLKRKQIASMIFCHASPIAKITINLGKHLNMINIPVYTVTDFARAAQLVQRLQKTEENVNASPRGSPPGRKNSPGWFPIPFETHLPRHIPADNEETPLDPYSARCQVFWATATSRDKMFEYDSKD